MKYLVLYFFLHKKYNLQVISIKLEYFRYNLKEFINIEN